MTTVYIIRHAEAEGNVYRRCHGQYDSLLTPRAYEQLSCLAKRFEQVPLDAVYSSDLFRARVTAQAVARAHGLPVVTRAVLREINMGDWEDLPWAELPRLWPEAYQAWRARPWSARPPHGESVIEAGQRMLNGVRDIVRENEGGSIAVVTHGSTIRGALTIAHGLAPEQMGEIGWGDNTCVAKFEFDGPDRLEITYENDASHLPQQLSTFASIGWTDKKDVPSTPQIWFRRADLGNPADVDRLIGYMRTLHRSAYGTDQNLDSDALLRDAAHALRVNPRAVTFGCLESGEEVALVYLKAFYESEPDVGLVGGFCVDENYRGQGLSGQILGQAISVYRTIGKMYLCAHVAAENARAKGFYRKFSFEPRGTFTDKNGLHDRMFLKISMEETER